MDGGGAVSDTVSKHIVHVYSGCQWHEGLSREHPDALVAYCHGLGRWRWWARPRRVGEAPTLSGAKEAAMAAWWDSVEEQGHG